MHLLYIWVKTIPTISPAMKTCSVQRVKSIGLIAVQNPVTEVRPHPRLAQTSSQYLVSSSAPSAARADCSDIISLNKIS